jgi:hypothetical protein
MDGQSDPQRWLEELSSEECSSFLQATSVGRLAFMGLYGFPVIFPVNYRFVESGDSPWLALRTRPGNVIDRAPTQVAFEIDGIDMVSRQGWSVLVRGNLHHAPAPAAEGRRDFDSEPWLAAERDSWLFIEPALISGRRLHPLPVEWAFHPRGYL